MRSPCTGLDLRLLLARQEARRAGQAARLGVGRGDRDLAGRLHRTRGLGRRNARDPRSGREDHCRGQHRTAVDEGFARHCHFARSVRTFPPFVPLTRPPQLASPHDSSFRTIAKADVPCRNRPHRLPYLVTHPADRIGTVSIPVDPERVVAIVETNKPDNTGKNAPETEESKQIAGHLINFFEEEVAAGRMPKNLLPLQSGIGNVANSIIGGLKESQFERMQVWTGAFAVLCALPFS